MWCWELPQGQGWRCWAGQGERPHTPPLLSTTLPACPGTRWHRGQTGPRPRWAELGTRAQSQGHGVASSSRTRAAAQQDGAEESRAALLLGMGVRGVLTKHKTAAVLPFLHSSLALFSASPPAAHQHSHHTTADFSLLKTAASVFSSGFSISRFEHSNRTGRAFTFRRDEHHAVKSQRDADAQHDWKLLGSGCRFRIHKARKQKHQILITRQRKGSTENEQT